MKQAQKMVFLFGVFVAFLFLASTMHIPFTEAKVLNCKPKPPCMYAPKACQIPTPVEGWCGKSVLGTHTRTRICHLQRNLLCSSSMKCGRNLLCRL